jgi:putative ABC transport system permease protein
VSWLELVRLAMSRLGTNRVRAALTMLGIIIGVASVVALVNSVEGATSGITNRLASLGTNLLTVNAGRVTTGFTRGGAGSAATLTLADAESLAAIPAVAAIAPEVQSQLLIVAGTKNTTTSVVGTTDGYAQVRNYSVWQGSFLNPASVESGLRVAVLGATTADDLGLDGSAVGTEIQVGGYPFTLVGILQPKGGSGPVSADDMVIIPISTARNYFVAGSSVRTIALSVATPAQIADVKTSVTSTLRERHGTTAGTDDFTIQDQAQLLDTASSVNDLLTALLAGIASISLLVGGIGIMNIMLVSVRERTREIGIRKAVGARGRDILAQFLIEALTISLVGGMIGLGIGLGATALIGTVAGWGIHLNPAIVLVAVGFSLIVGIVFGVWPARQAARLDPITALRYE